jgi:hypothetical protein
MLGFYLVITNLLDIARKTHSTNVRGTGPLTASS